jgi:hypothetical protein
MAKLRLCNSEAGSGAYTVRILVISTSSCAVWRRFLTPAGPNHRSNYDYRNELPEASSKHFPAGLRLNNVLVRRRTRVVASQYSFVFGRCRIQMSATESLCDDFPLPYLHRKRARNAAVCLCCANVISCSILRVCGCSDGMLAEIHLRTVHPYCRY